MTGLQNPSLSYRARMNLFLKCNYVEHFSYVLKKHGFSELTESPKSRQKLRGASVSFK